MCRYAFVLTVVVFIIIVVTIIVLVVDIVVDFVIASASIQYAPRRKYKLKFL